MTPNNVTDREASAVMEAFGIKTGSAETVQNAGGDKNVTVTAPNSESTTQVRTIEKTQGAEKKPTKVIEIGSQTQTKQVNQPETKVTPKTEQNNVQDVAKTISEMLGDTPDNIKVRLGRQVELEEMVKKSPYKSPFGEVFDDLVSKNIAPDVALRFITSDKEKMSMKEVMAFALQQERPGISMDKITDYIDQTYKLGKYAENGDEAPGMTRLEFDVQPHLQKFDELKQKLLQNGGSRQNIEDSRKESARLDAWKPATKQIFESFNKIEIPTPSGAILRYNVKMDAAEQNELLNEFGAMLKNPNLVADENGIASAAQALRDRYVAKHMNEMAVAFMNQGRSMSNEEWMQLVHNPSMSNTAGQEDFGNKGDRDTNIAAMILEAEGGRKK